MPSNKFNPAEIHHDRPRQPRTINGGMTRPFIPTPRGGAAPVPPAGRKRGPNGGK